jgi:hypothetical protein
MANTYTLIASNTLTGTTASVTFSSIPGTYTDLVLRFATRDSSSAVFRAIDMSFNSSTSNFSYTRIVGSGSTVTSSRSTTNNGIPAASVGDTATSNTFSNGELYLPNYTASQNKPFSVSVVTENNATEAYATAFAGLWSNTSAISSISFAASANFLSGSSFFLYGIKNS